MDQESSGGRRRCHGRGRRKGGREGDGGLTNAGDRARGQGSWVMGSGSFKGGRLCWVLYRFMDIDTYTHIQIHTYTETQMQTQKHTHIPSHRHTHTHNHIHAHTTHTYTLN